MENKTKQVKRRLGTVKECAVALNVSPSGLYRKFKTGELPCHKFGRKVLGDIDELLEVTHQPMRTVDPHADVNGK